MCQRETFFGGTTRPAGAREGRPISFLARESRGADSGPERPSFRLRGRGALPLVGSERPRETCELGATKSTAGVRMTHTEARRLSPPCEKRPSGRGLPWKASRTLRSMFMRPGHGGVGGEGPSGVREALVRTPERAAGTRPRRRRAGAHDADERLAGYRNAAAPRESSPAAALQVGPRDPRRRHARGEAVHAVGPRSGGLRGARRGTRRRDGTSDDPRDPLPDLLRLDLPSPRRGGRPSDLRGGGGRLVPSGSQGLVLAPPGPPHPGAPRGGVGGRALRDDSNDVPRGCRLDAVDPARLAPGAPLSRPARVRPRGLQPGVQP